MTREELARAQAGLLRALLADGELLPGFVAADVAAEAAALRAKRARAVARARPDLAADLGERYRDLFDAYARTHPKAVGVSTAADAAAFAGWLDRRRPGGRRTTLSRWARRSWRRSGPR